MPSEEQQIQAGMMQWEPGSLSTGVLERILTDALADLWWDCYRQGEPQRDRITRYKAALKRLNMIAIGLDISP